MRILKGFSTKIEERTGLPGRFMVAALVAGLSLQVALVGMYYDIAWHIDNGRDQQIFTLPHLLIVVGLQGLVVAAALHALLPGPKARGERSLPFFGWTLSPGGLQLLACGAIALIAFPLDDVWHRLFGEDVTLWGPTHLFMIGGASFSTLGVWLLIRHAYELGDATKHAPRTAQWRIAGGLLVGLCTFQAEYDFGVPQFRLLYQPVLIALAAGLGLVCARELLGRFGALYGLGYFLLLRGSLALLVGPVLGFTTPRFPLLIVEALVVEAAYLNRARWGATRTALVAGLGVGTL